MKDILKPVVVLAIGVVIGAVGFWLAAKPDVNITGSLKDFPDVKGISGGTFASLENQTVMGVQVNTTLEGYVTAVTGQVVLMINGQGNQEVLGVIVNDETTIVEAPKEGSGEARVLQLADLKTGDYVNVFATVQGTAIVAQSITRLEQPQ